MPYKTNKDLPQGDQDKYDSKGQMAFREAWMAAHAAGKSEAECRAIAHAAAQKAMGMVQASFEAIEWVLVQASLGQPAEDGWVWPAELVKAGMSKIQIPGQKLPVFIAAEFIAAAASHFEGSPAYSGHQPEGADKRTAYIGVWKNVRAEGPILLGDLHLKKNRTDVRDDLLASRELGRMPEVSIKAMVGYEKQKRDGTEVLAALAPIANTPRSADIVMDGAAGGRLLSIAAEEELQGALDSARQQFLKVSPAPGRDILGSDKRSDSERKNKVKQSILNILASLRALAGLGESAKTQITSIEAECNASDANFENLLEKASTLTAELTAPPKPGDGKVVYATAAEVTALMARLEAAQKAQRIAESRLLLNRKIAASKLPMPLQAEVRRRCEGRESTEVEIDAEITALRTAAAAIVPSPGRISGSPVIEMGLSGRDKLQTALDRLFGVTHLWNEVRDRGMIRAERGAEIDRKVPSFGGIREAYVAFTGDVDIRGEVSEEFSRETDAEYISTGFPYALAATMNRLLLQGYAEPNYGLDLLVPAGNRKSVSDFKTQERIRVGYFGDLPLNDPELTDWPEIASPTDEKANYAVVQFGGLVTVTRKTIINDDLGIVREIVAKLGRAAHRTVAQRVFNLLTANAATTYDAVTWFHASSHGANLTTTALSAAEIEVIAKLMYAQTEKDSGKVLGIEASILVVPRALQATAHDLNEYQPVEAAKNPSWHRFGANSERIITSPLLTDATDFYVFADQILVPCIELGFFQGREQPELFLADNPVVGKAFISDRIQYKIRHEYESVVIDHRGAHRATVA